MADALPLAYLVALGLIVGSFLNVCIYRIPSGGSIAWPASHCPACKDPIRWFDNIPIVSFIVLGGRCRHCGARISFRYPAVELITAALFAIEFWAVGWQPLLLPRLLFVSALVVLFVIDLQHHILPNVITLPGIAVGFALSLFFPPGWVSALIGIVVGGGVLFLVAEAYYRVRKEEGLGMGDVKMLAMIGAFLGWQLALLTLVLSSFAGSLFGVGLMIAGRGGLKYALPYGTFLALAAITSALFGREILRWYFSFYG
ncbi:MAG: prepilin peptidase [Acidobacteria bacterium]|nr:prepilin peptidase [Acidobacteriota bacterium]